MKKSNVALFLFINLLVLPAILLSLQTTSFSQEDPGWPRQKVGKLGNLIYYQPQVDAWSDHKQLAFRVALTITPTGKPTTVGVAVVTAQTDVDVDNRTVLIHDLVVTETHFPSLDPAASGKMNDLVKTFLPRESFVTISLDRLVASVEKPADAPTVAVRNDPPRIFVSNGPSILVHVDGDPVFGKIKDTKLEFVVNSNFPLFLDRSKDSYYLFTGDQWLTTANLQGQWSKTTALPKDMTKLKADTQWAGLASAIPARASSKAIPTVFYATSPAEVILFQGPPVFTAIPGTRLVYASNTDSDLFVENRSRMYYYLAAGRWFRSNSLDGPWTYATADLPEDFSKIPTTSAASRVLASVPGTEQAKDAVLLAQIPTTVIVDAKSAAAQAKVEYTGTPEFKPIQGTTLYYATNTAEKVIRVGEVYYLCLNGVWFFSSSALGPWTTATSVPSSIYAIPPSSPVYNVTYVTQTTTSSGSVQSSYTAGYLGTFIVGVTVGAIIANGSGYYYPPYYHFPVYGYPIYRPYPVTYGVGAYYNHYTGAYGVARGVYGPYGGVTGHASYNPYTGTYRRGATAYGPYGSASAGRAYNPYTGTAAVTRQGSTAYGQWGSSVVSRGNQAVQTGHVSSAGRTVAGARSTTGAKAIAGSGYYGSGAAVKTSGGDMYAARDGNVYKNTGSGWEQHNGNGGWNPVNTPQSRNTPQTRPTTLPTSSTANRPQMQSGTYNNLNTQMQSRERGASQTTNFQRSRSAGANFSPRRSGTRRN